MSPDRRPWSRDCAACCAPPALTTMTSGPKNSRGTEGWLEARTHRPERLWEDAGALASRKRPHSSSGRATTGGGQEAHQLCDRDVVEVGDRVDERPPQVRVRMLRGDPVKLLDGARPGQGPRVETGVVQFLDAHSPARAPVDADRARHTLGKLATVFRPRPYRDSLQQRLYVVAADPFRTILSRGDLTVQQRHRNHVGKAVVGFLLGPDATLVTFLAAADDMVRDIKDVDVDPVDIGTADAV